MSQEVHGSFTFELEPRAPEVSAGDVVSVPSGEYAIFSAHSGFSLAGIQMGKRSIIREAKSAACFELLSADGGYLIRTDGGYLREQEDADQVLIAETGTIWTLRVLPNTDAIEICGSSGRVLEVDWRAYGSWAWMADRSGGSNQEWRLDPWTGSHPARLPAMMARVRRDGTETAIRTARELAAPTVTWKRDGDAYLYQAHATGDGIQSIWINKDARYDAAGVSAPDGWQFMFRGWGKRKSESRGGDFVMRSSYAPGPVLTSVWNRGAAGILYRGNETTRQEEHLGHAETSQGSYAWAIGPAIEPRTDEAGLRKLVDQWNTDGLAFLWPLLDESRSIAGELLEVMPSSDFEREVLDAIRSFVGGGK
jgi:hypothetical protein